MKKPPCDGFSLMIKRAQLHEQIETTLSREFVAEDSINYFDIEDPSSLARLARDAQTQHWLRGVI